MNRIKYLVTDIDTYINLERALDDKSFARVFNLLDAAERYAIDQSYDQEVAIHKYNDNRYVDLLSIVWNGDIYDKR